MVVPDVYPPIVTNRTLLFIHFQFTWEISQTKPALSTPSLPLPSPPIKRLLRLQIQTLKIRKKSVTFGRRFLICSQCIYIVYARSWDVCLVDAQKLLWGFIGAEYQSKKLSEISLLHLLQLWKLCSEWGKVLKKAQPFGWKQDIVPENWFCSLHCCWFPLSKIISLNQTFKINDHPLCPSSLGTQHTLCLLICRSAKH